MVVKINVAEDEELRSYLKELLRGQVKSIVREEIARMIREEFAHLKDNLSSRFADIGEKETKLLVANILGFNPRTPSYLAKEGVLYQAMISEVSSKADKVGDEVLKNRGAAIEKAVIEKTVDKISTDKVLSAVLKKLDS